jgi:hypothetical protein
MAHTQDAVIVDATGIVHMVVIPDDDSELDDPAFNAPGMSQLRVPMQAPSGQPIGVAQMQAAAALHPAMNARLPPSPVAPSLSAQAKAALPQTPQ